MSIAICPECNVDLCEKFPNNNAKCVHRYGKYTVIYYPIPETHWGCPAEVQIFNDTEDSAILVLPYIIKMSEDRIEKLLVLK